MKKLLLSGLGGSLFPYLHDKLTDKYEVYYVDGDFALTKLYPDYNFFAAPLVTDDSYIDFIKNIISKYNIDYYIPLIDEEIVNAKKDVEGYDDVKVIAPNVGFCELSLNKYKLMGVLKELKISNITSYMGNDFSWDIDLPIFVKPINGRGSRGIRKINSKAELEAYYLLEKYKPAEILIQQLIIGTEYTIGATVNNLNQLLAISIKKVIRKKGITQIAVTENNDLLYKTVQKVVSELKPCGPINIQLYLTAKGEVKIFEINPRFSTTTIMGYAGGVDEISLYIDNYNKRDITNIIQPKTGLVLHRRWESIFYEA